MWSKKVANFQDDSMAVSGKDVPIKRGKLSNGDLRFWIKNPRIYSIVHATEEPLDQSEIQAELQAKDHVKQLYRDIKHHGGIIDPIVVVDKGFYVIEGNSRLAAVRQLAQIDPAKFGMMRCIVLPEDVGEKVIYSFLNQEHIQGKTHWSPYEQAGVIYRLVEDDAMDFKTLSEEMGISTRKAHNMYQIYDFMVKNNEDKPSRYSYYEVYLSNRKATGRRAQDPELDKRIVEEIKKGEFTAQEFRTMLPHVCESDKEIKKVLSGNTSILDAYHHLEKEGKTEDLVKRLQRMHSQLKSMTKEEFDALNAKAQKDAEYQLKRIITLTQNLKKKVYG